MSADDPPVYADINQVHVHAVRALATSSPASPPRLAILLIPLLLLPLSLLLFALSAISQADMAALWSFIKALILPAILAAALYLSLTYLIIPLYRRHRNRYSQYLPVSTSNPISSLSTSTSTLRARVSDALTSFILPSRWAERRWRNRNSARIVDARDDEDEEMGGYLQQEDDDSDGDTITDGRGRRDGLSLSMDARSRTSSREVDDRRRLSRELEEGFADSSDDDEEEGETTPAARRGLR